uniref:Preprotein translocase subunit SecE n=1 Tax=Heterorhabditis bacteriophora TaxID=37862 RepID=A0A1I7XC84_HETBA
MTDRGREREQRRKRRRESDIDDESGITGWKLGMVIGVIVVCFAMLYPTVLHSVLMGMLG